MNISWNQYSTYVSCPLKFLWSAQNKPVPEPYWKRPMVFGMVAQRVIEDFYNQKYYLLKGECRKRMRLSLETHYAQHLVRYPVYFTDDADRVKFQEEIWDGVQKFLDMIIKHQLLGEYAASEVGIMVKLNRLMTISGTLDIVVERSGKVILADGKATQHGRKFINTEQLVFYALLFSLKNGKLPDELVYLLFLSDDYFPVEFTQDSLTDLQVKISDVMQKMRDKQFAATPSWNSCNLCQYRGICPEFSKFKLEQKIKEFSAQEKEEYVSLYTSMD